MVTPLSKEGGVVPYHADKREDFSHQHYMELKHFWKYYTVCPPEATYPVTVFFEQATGEFLYDESKLPP